MSLRTLTSVWQAESVKRSVLLFSAYFFRLAVLFVSVPCFSSEPLDDKALLEVDLPSTRAISCHLVPVDSLETYIQQVHVFLNANVTTDPEILRKCLVLFDWDGVLYGKVANGKKDILDIHAALQHLSALKEKGVPLMVLTARGPDLPGHVCDGCKEDSSCPIFKLLSCAHRIQRLNGHSSQEIFADAIGKPILFESFYDDVSNRSLLTSGVLFSPQNKGFSLLGYLKQIEQKQTIEHVFFIDDQRDRLHEVVEAVARYGHHFSLKSVRCFHLKRASRANSSPMLH
ncbi:MAG: DUF2608 domain-containing protein [Holosporales bacterium]